MALMARAASSTVFSETMTSSCGRRVWSITSTDQPLAASQIVRYGLPSMFTRPLHKRRPEPPPPCGEGLGVGGLPTSEVLQSPPPCPSPTSLGRASGATGEGTLRLAHRHKRRLEGASANGRV